jgi:glutamyl-tRNA reductase
MPLVCMGLSHNTAPVDVRERHAFPAAVMGEALVALRDYEAVREALMLQTCGRLEIYAELDDYETGVGQIRQFLGNFRHSGVEDMDSYMYTLLGSQAVDHLLRVSTGLDSMLIGEADILHQVKDAFVQGQRARTVGSSLHALFREAINAGKAARTHTAIGAESTSIATAAANLALGHLGGRRDACVAVVGAGKMASLVARRLRSAGCSDIVVVNRSEARARTVVAAIGTGRTVALPGIVDALTAADIVITSTGASTFVLTAEGVAAAMHARPERQLFIVDIAVPRDCEPAVAELPNVDVVDVDGLRDVVDITLERRREAIPMVEEIIAEHAARFRTWYRGRAAAPAISALVEEAEALRETELERLFARCPDLTERERMLITGMSLTIVSRLLHGPIATIRDDAVR